MKNKNDLVYSSWISFTNKSGGELVVLAALKRCFAFVTGLQTAKAVLRVGLRTASRSQCIRPLKRSYALALAP